MADHKGGKMIPNPFSLEIGALEGTPQADITPQDVARMMNRYFKSQEQFEQQMDEIASRIADEIGMVYVPEGDVLRFLDPSLVKGMLPKVPQSFNPRMSMREFIRQNRDEIDAAIRRALGDFDFRLNDREREMWIRNDEALYHWARSEGVRV